MTGMPKIAVPSITSSATPMIPLGRGDSQTGDSLQHDASPLFGDPLTDQR